MKLPRFPIRKSLIPYDDLGIQEVSGDNQVLGDDIPITISTIQGLGASGSRIFKLSNADRLITSLNNDDINSNSSKCITIISDNQYPTDVAVRNIDVSKWHEAIFVLSTSTNDAGTQTFGFIITAKHNEGTHDIIYNSGVIANRTTKFVYVCTSGDIKIMPNTIDVYVSLDNVITTAEVYLYAHVR